MATYVVPADVAELTPPGGAGVVDEQVEPAVLFFDDRGHARGRIVAKQVDGDHGRGAKLVGKRAQPVLAPRDQHELRAGLARDAGRSPHRYAGRAAGHQSDHRATSYGRSAASGA